ncbi:MAG: hypothetical protein HGA96_05190 [Desulfobulbaceae bacterium]|nr:hypothetical protein [Desulfobulbaceae bacterium]
MNYGHHRASSCVNIVLLCSVLSFFLIFTSASQAGTTSRRAMRDDGVPIYYQPPHREPLKEQRIKLPLVIHRSDPDFIGPMVINSQTGEVSQARQTAMKFPEPTNLADYPDQVANPLHAAVRKNDGLAVQELLAAGANINDADKFDQTPLSIAILSGHDDLAKNLVLAGANVNLPDHNVCFSTRFFAEMNPSHGSASLKTRGFVSTNPLYLAITLKNDPLAIFLYENGALIDLPHYPCSKDDKHSKPEADVPETETSRSALREVLSLDAYGLADVIIRKIDSVNQQVIVDKLLGYFAPFSTGEPEKIKFLLAHGADINTCQNGLTPLRHVIKSRIASFRSEDRTREQERKREVVAWLLDNGADLFCKDAKVSVEMASDPVSELTSEGSYELADKILHREGAERQQQIASHLMLFVSGQGGGNLHKLFEFLMEHGASVEEFDSRGRTPLMLAVNSGNLEAATLLLDNGAIIDTAIPHTDGKSVDEGATALMLALQKTPPSEQHLSLVNLLLARGTNVKLRDKNNRGAANYLASGSISLELLEILSSLGADLDLSDAKGNTPLKLVLDRNLQVFADIRTAKGEAINNDRELVHERKHLDIADFLVAKGADINTGKINMLEFLVKERNATVDFMLAHNYNLNIGKKLDGTREDYTPLILAAELGNTVFAEKFIKHGADVNHVTPKGDTPLLLAILSGNLEMVTLLVEAGADLNHEYDKERSNSYTIAHLYGQKDIAYYLSDKGADTSGFITNPLTIGMLKQIGIVPPETEGLPVKVYEFYKAALAEELGLNFMDKFNNPDPQFSSPEKTWELYKKALIAGNLDLAAKCHRHDSKYIETYKALGPETTREITMSFRPIEKITGDEKSGKYRITREQNGVDITYYIYFVNVLGEWKIDQF